MSEAQNVVNTLQQQRHELLLKLNALQAAAQRHAFAAVVENSWKARQDFRTLSRLRIGLAMRFRNLAPQEAYMRLQSRGREAGVVMQELGLGANKQRTMCRSLSVPSHS
jgi:hypothetical protein